MEAAAPGEALIFENLEIMNVRTTLAVWLLRVHLQRLHVVLPVPLAVGVVQALENEEKIKAERNGQRCRNKIEADYGGRNCFFFEDETG